MSQSTTLPALTGAERWDVYFEPEQWGKLEELLPGYMRPRRWFSGKARTVAETQVQAAIPLDYAGGRAFLTLLRVVYADGGAETYVLPLAYAEAGSLAQSALPEHALVAQVGEGTLFDPIYAPDFCAALLDLIAHQKQLAAGDGMLIASTTSAFPELRGPNDLPLAPKVSTAEQSNSSIIFGDRLIMKLFRRLEPGLNPDLEIGAFLTEAGNFANIPPVAGALEYDAGTRMTLALLQGFVPNRGDAWYYTLDTIAATFTELLVAPNATPPGGAAALLDDSAHELPDAAARLLGSYADSAALLGRRTGEMHLALASGSAPNFAPEPFTPTFQAAMLRSMDARAQQSFDLLRGSVANLPAALQADAQRVLEHEGDVFDRLRAALDQPIDAQRTRIHGDYHLGQVLYTGSDFFIIDFEGEPARPLDERREKGAALQDVAGMLRSLHYAPYAVLFGQAPGVAFDEGQRTALEPWARAWHRWAGAAFLRSYLATVGNAPFVPHTRAALHTLLEAYLLDKAVYELRYELNNRPDWAGIPIEGVLQQIGSA